MRTWVGILLITLAVMVCEGVLGYLLVRFGTDRGLALGVLLWIGVAPSFLIGTIAAFVHREE